MTEKTKTGLPMDPNAKPVGVQGTGPRDAAWTDTNRLDWLARAHFDVLYRDKGINRGGMWYVGADEAYFEESGRTLRDALDKAMKAAGETLPAIQSPANPQDSTLGAQGGQKDSDG